MDRRTRPLIKPWLTAKNKLENSPPLLLLLILLLLLLLLSGMAGRSF